MSATLRENRYGHFSGDGREYVITDPRTPRPWVNVIANPRLGLVVSHTGSGFTFIDNSQLGVITRWQQELVEDCSGKALYLRDVATGRVWSAAPAPGSYAVSMNSFWNSRRGAGATPQFHSR
jgi:cellobiose phosphorylase